MVISGSLSADFGFHGALISMMLKFFVVVHILFVPYYSKMSSLADRFGCSPDPLTLESKGQDQSSFSWMGKNSIS